MGADPTATGLPRRETVALAVFTWQEQIEPAGPRYGVAWAITDRWGGSSQGLYGEFNLATHVGDGAAAVETNRHRLAHALGLPLSGLRFMDQRHGCQVALTPGTGRSGTRATRPARHPDEDPPAADAVISDQTGEALVVLVADCTPVLLADLRAGLIAAVHAGRPGLISGVVPAAAAKLKELGAGDLQAVVGPSICPRCYEVPPQMRAEASGVSAPAASVSWSGTPAIDVAAGVVQQLADAEVSMNWLPGCSRERQDLYSHRRDGRTGRYAGVVRLLPPEQAA